MDRPPLTGTRIRSYRVDRGLRQAALARNCGISASYLNLIEHNRRNIGGALLLKIADELGVAVNALSGGAEAALALTLEAAAEAHPQTDAERPRAVELAGRFPGWARLIEAQQDKIRRLEEIIEQLGDRLTHDPYLSASMHSVLSSVTAIRSASAILAKGESIAPEWESRFHRNIFEDSQRLAETTETLVKYLDADPVQNNGATLPQDEVDTWLESAEWRCAPLESDPTANLDDIIADADMLQSAAARQIARRLLRRYARDVETVPLKSLREVLQETPSPLELSQFFGVDLPCIFRRLSALRPDDCPDGLTYGLVACDGSGTLIFRKPAPGFTLPRFSAACPLWPLFQALQRPLAPISQSVTMAGRNEASFDTTAISHIHYPEGFGGPAVVEAWMLIQPQLMTDSLAKQRVGTSCRVCSVVECVARREPSVIELNQAEQRAL